MQDIPEHRDVAGHVERALAALARGPKGEAGSQVRRDLAAVREHLVGAKARMVSLERRLRRLGGAAALALAASLAAPAEAEEVLLPYEVGCLDTAALELLIERDGYELVGTADAGESLFYVQPGGEGGWLLLLGRGRLTCVLGAGVGWEPAK